jgi:hypothetical protein
MPYRNWDWQEKAWNGALQRSWGFSDFLNQAATTGSPALSAAGQIRQGLNLS